jgi:hypothetical protein
LRTAAEDPGRRSPDVRSRFPPFLINDPDHAPFGREWLRGITPARIGVLAAVLAVLAVPWLRMGIIKGDYELALTEAG